MEERGVVWAESGRRVPNAHKTGICRHWLLRALVGLQGSRTGRYREDRSERAEYGGKGRGQGHREQRMVSGRPNSHRHDVRMCREIVLARATGEITRANVARGFAQAAVLGGYPLELYWWSGRREREGACSVQMSQECRGGTGLRWELDCLGFPNQYAGSRPYPPLVAHTATER